MKFNRRLKQEAYPLYVSHYIAYKELKKAIKLITGIDTSQHTISEVTTNFGDTGAFTGSAYRPSEARFQDLLNYEVQKINNFATLIYTSTAASLQSALQRIPEINVLEQFASVLDNAESAADGVCYLHEYVQLNLTGFRKITKKYDKHGCRNSSAWYMSRLVKEPFVNLDFDALIHLIAQCFSNLSQCKERLSKPHLSSLSHEEEQLTTTTYFVSEEELLQSRVCMAKLFPLKASGRRQGLSKPVFVKTEEEQIQHEKTTISPTKLIVDDTSGVFSNPLIYTTKSERMSHGCLYFDNLETFQNYHQCLNSYLWNDDNVVQTPPLMTCLRFRWPAEVPTETNYHDHTSHENSSSQTPVSTQNETEASDATPNVILEFIDPKCLSSDPHEWFDIPFDNASPPFPNAVQISVQDADAILKNKFDLQRWIQQQLLLNPCSKSRVSEMKKILTEALEYIHQKGNIPVWQMCLYRNSYRGISFDVSVDNYRRNQTAFYPQSNYVNVYLDENVQFIPWKNDPQLTFAEQINVTNVLITANFKTSSFGILSVSRSENRPSILKRLTGLTTVLEVWMYASLLHGTSTLYSEELPPRCLPHWYKFVTQGTDDFQKNDSAEKPKPPGTARVDVIPIRPRDRIAHDHVATAEHEKHSDEEDERVVQSQRSPIKKKTMLKSQQGKGLPSSLQEPLLANETLPRTHIVEISQDFTSRPLVPLIARTRAFFSKCFSLLSIQRWWAREPNKPLATVRVEPKTFFANERTLLQWMNTAVLLSTISITLLNFGTYVGRVAGFILSPVAIFFIIYPFFVYLSRSFSLERKEPINYNDRFGPTILVICLIGALSAIIVLNIIYGGHG